MFRRRLRSSPQSKQNGQMKDGALFPGFLMLHLRALTYTNGNRESNCWQGKLKLRQFFRGLCERRPMRRADNAVQLSKRT